MEYYSPSNVYKPQRSYLWVWIILGLALVFFFLGMWWANNKSHRSYYSNDNPIINKVRENFGKMHPDYFRIPIREGDSSYTEGKKFITLCLKNPETGGYYDMNTIMYVALHELAHLVSSSYGTPGDEHNAEFRKNFNMLLDRAEKLGFYNPSIPIPKTYCGVTN